MQDAADVVYHKLANEVLAQSLSPHVRFMVLPRLCAMDINHGALIRCIHGGVVSGCVYFTTELLYSVLLLVHPMLESAKLDDLVVVDYLRLISLLLDHSHVIYEGVSHDKEEDTDDEVGLIKDDQQPVELTSLEGLFQHCMDIVGGSKIASTLHSRKWVWHVLYVYDVQLWTR